MASTWVIGGANIDICGVAENNLRERDSNIGRIALSFGGVGRNIAQTVCLLGGDVKFVTCFSDDHFGRALRADCEALGMDCSRAVTIRHFPSSMYIALLEPHGDLRMGMSDMRVLEELTDEVIDRALTDLDPDDILVIDSNLDEDRIRRIVGKAPCRIAADPVSANKAPKLLPVLDRIRIFKPNDVEAEHLSGIRVTDAASAAESLRFFLERGVEEVLLTMAREGLAFAWREADGACSLRHLRHRELNVQHTNGGGDALLGAYLVSRQRGEEPLAAARFALGAAALALEESALQERTLSNERVRAAADGLEIKEVVL